MVAAIPGPTQGAGRTGQTRERRPHRQHLALGAGHRHRRSQLPALRRLHDDHTLFHLQRRIGHGRTARSRGRTHSAPALAPFFPRGSRHGQRHRHGHDHHCRGRRHHPRSGLQNRGSAIGVSARRGHRLHGHDSRRRAAVLHPGLDLSHAQRQPCGRTGTLDLGFCRAVHRGQNHSSETGGRAHPSSVPPDIFRPDRRSENDGHCRHLRRPGAHGPAGGHLARMVTHH